MLVRTKNPTSFDPVDDIDLYIWIVSPNEDLMPKWMSLEDLFFIDERYFKTLDKNNCT